MGAAPAYEASSLKHYVQRRQRNLNDLKISPQNVLSLMKNIQVIDGADNCVYEIFAATDEEFSVIFLAGQDIAFIDEVCSRTAQASLEKALTMIWTRRLRKNEAHGIHGTLFYEHERKKVHYPTRRDEEAANPDGSRIRRPLNRAE